MRSCSPIRYSVSTVSSVRQIRRRGGKAGMEWDSVAKSAQWRIGGLVRTREISARLTKTGWSRMLRLRELAGAAGLAMLAMTAVVAFPTLQAIHVTFHPEVASNTIRLASEQANSALHYAFGGTQPAAPQKQPQPVAVPDPAQAIQADAADRLRSKIP